MNVNKKYCELDSSKLCDNCNKCNLCDLDPRKICDSCGKCLDLNDNDYIEIKINGLFENEEEDAEEYIEEETSIVKTQEENESSDWLYIEDIPELKEKYDKQIEEILHINKNEK